MHIHSPANVHGLQVAAGCSLHNDADIRDNSCNEQRRLPSPYIRDWGRSQRADETAGL